MRVQDQKSGKLWINLHGTILKGNHLVQPKTRAQNESSLFEDPRCKLGSKVRSNSRVQFASNESKLVPRNLDPGPAQSKVGLNAIWLVRKGMSPRELTLGSLFSAAVFLCKSIPNGAQYATLQKYFSHPSLLIFFFATPPIKLKPGLQIGGNY